MRLLLDTNLLLWTAFRRARLSPQAITLMAADDVVLVFSAISIAEVAIKSALGKPDFDVDADVFRRGLIENGYVELALTSLHAAALARLPAIHKDPFDRLLLAQATAEGITLLTSDETVSRYGGPARLV